jgi:1,2-diacylglycerol 3-alpha-glucosyltransferase
MKIGLFTDTYVPQVNGVVTVVRTLKEGLEARGHEVSIVTVSHPDAVPMPGVHRIPSVKFPPEPQHRFGIFGGTIAVALVRKLGLDIIHTHTEFTLNAAAVTAGRLCKIPVISTLHTYYPDYVHYIPLIGGMIQGSMSPLMRIAFARKACIVAPSGKIRDFLLDCAIATPMEVFERGKERSARAEAFRERFALDSRHFHFVFVGRLAQEKNMQTTLVNFKRASDENPAVRLLVVGDGPYRKNLESLTATLGLTDKVVFTGYVEWPHDIVAAYDNSQAFVSASHSEVHPITFIEAMASGLPIVAAADASIVGMVEEGKSGFVFEDDGMIWKGLVEVAADRDRARKMGERGVGISSAYAMDSFIDKMELIYERYRKKRKGEFVDEEYPERSGQVVPCIVVRQDGGRAADSRRGNVEGVHESLARQVPAGQ